MVADVVLTPLEVTALIAGIDAGVVEKVKLADMALPPGPAETTA
jgi:hypothetical protein